MVIGRKTLVVRKAGGTLGLTLSLRRGAHGLLRGRSDRSRFGSARGLSASRPAGPTIATSHRSLSNQTGPATPKPRPSSAMTNSSTSCRSGSSCSQDRAFPTILRTKLANSASRCSISGKAAARERCRPANASTRCGAPDRERLRYCVRQSPICRREVRRCR